MPAPSGRRHVHTRTIRVDAYARDDGLWDLAAELIDAKSKEFTLATSTSTPDPGHCETITPDYRQLVGLNLVKDFRRHVRERLGGVRGCTHLTELVNVLPSAAVQAFANEVYQARDVAHPEHYTDDRKPFQIDRCHALRSNGAAVAKFYPRWHRAGDAEPDSN
jgi:hypothetical protein